MSGILGIYQGNGQPVDRALLGRMMGHLAHRGPDGRAMWIDGPVGLAHLMLHTTPESLRESQPMADPSGSLHLTLDGRLDNREDLQDIFLAKGRTLSTGTDAELVLAAYDCWEEEAPFHLLGDFAFAIWDGRRRRLFCARDQIGIKPFYYYRGDGFFLFGSELRPLLAHPLVPRQPNEGMVGEYLANQITSQEETLFRDLFRLPPAHCLIVTPDSVRKARYWDADLSKELRYGSDAEYAAHFLSIFGEAVRCRLRSSGPVGADLSGGLDSSSVVGMAQSLIRQGTVLDKGIETFSLIFPGMACDESCYIDSVVQRWNLPANKLLPEFVDAKTTSEQIRQHLDFPDYPNQTMSNSLSVLAREKNIVVTLTGIGGDDWMGTGFSPFADLLRSGHLTALCQVLRKDAAGQGLMRNVKELLSVMLPSRLRRAYTWAFQRDGVPPWIDRDFARRVDLADRLRASLPTGPFISYAQRDLFLSLRSGEYTLACELVDRSAARFGVENRHPFNDRRFIGFALSLPQSQRQRDGQIKFIVRHAMHDMLPDLVRERQAKVEFSPVFLRAFEALGGQAFFASLVAASQGWVRQETVGNMYAETLSATSSPAAAVPHLWPLWMVAGIEVWFKTVFMEPIDHSSYVRPYEKTAVPLA